MNDSLPTEKISSIRCTACGAPLTLHGGGHKIQTLNCAYCGAVMDARHDFAVLAQFANQHRPECPLELGMQGKLKGVDFTIIGMIAWFAEGEWVDLLLYSPTHGYAWLSYEQGLNAAAGALKFTYTLTPRVSVVTRAGEETALDVFYNFSFD